MTPHPDVVVPEIPAVGAFEAEVLRVEHLGRSLRRVTLGGAGLEHYGFTEHPRDRRFKLIIPPDGGEPVLDLPGIVREQHLLGVSWYQAWLQTDPALRGTMRTYTVRAWDDARRELVVDMVLHVDDQGRSGPAARWAAEARPGCRVHLIGPSRHAEPSTGAIDFRPGAARHLLMVGDETALPAISSILDHLRGSGVRGHVVIEVPCAADVQDFGGAEGFEVTWCVRRGSPHGRPMVSTVRQLLGDAPSLRAAAGLGEEFYAWLAGEAEAVKHLRRALVREHGVDKARVTFSGYWKLGRAEGA